MVVSQRSLLINRAVDDGEPSAIPAARFAETIGQQFARGNVHRITIETQDGHTIALWVDY